MTQARFVGRQHELAHLRNSLALSGRGRIICIAAGPGMGKSWLLHEFASQAAALAARTALIDFGADQAYDALTLVRQLRDALGAEAFAPLTATINALTAPRIATSAVRQQQVTRPDAAPAATPVKDNLFVVQTDNPLLLQAIEAQVTHAFFICLAGLAARGPLLLLFDSYEQCSHERDHWLPTLADRWIRRELLSRIRSGALLNTVVVLAGRQLPPFDASWAAVLDELPLEPDPPHEAADDLRGTCDLAQLSDRTVPTRYAVTQGQTADEALSRTLAHLLATAGEPRAELLRRAAIPRWIDAGVLAALQEPEEPGADHLAALRAYSFVRELSDGRLALPAPVRAALLTTWRQDRPEALQQLQLRLYQHFSQQTTPPGTTGGAMPLLPDSTVLSVVQASGDAELRQREAIYHLLHIDPELGLDQLRASYAHLAASMRCAEAERLLAMAAAAVVEAALGPRQRRWVQYLRAHLLHATHCRAEAAAQLTALQAHGDLEPDLAGYVSRSLGLILAEQGHVVQAIELYRQSLAHFARTGEQQALAETLLLLGAAYQELAARAGDWHVPVVPQSLLLRAGSALWNWLLALPFLIASLVLEPGNRLLPVTEHCAHYQNWLRIRLTNAARSWYAQARDAFQQLGDATGALRAEQHLADLVLNYGYPDEARAAVEELLRQPAARDPYLRAWLQRSLAACELASGHHEQATALLSELHAFFAELGDTRRAATVLALRGRAALRAGDSDRAVDDFSVALGQFRTLEDTTAREQILAELRAWQERPDTSVRARLRIDALLAAELEQRYVERFIPSYRDLLRSATALALPLALLLMALVAPVSLITPQPNGVVSSGIFFDPWRALGVLATLLLIAMAGYAALATAIIAWLPIGRIEREQPDALITRPDAIARYDRHGQLVSELPWAAVRRWLSLDRCLWQRPLALHSRTVLEGAPGQGLAIDGLTGWYRQLQQDIGRRLALAGTPPVERRQLGGSLLRSPWGVLIGLGVLLLLLVTWTNNGWLPLSPLLTPPLAAAIWFLALSGGLILAPIAVWLAARPGTLEEARPGRRWPLLIGALGAGAVLLAGLAGDQFVRIEALRYGLAVWGAAVLADALLSTLLPGQRIPRLVGVATTVALSLALIGRPALAHYYWLEGALARTQVQHGLTAAAERCAAAATARELGAGTYATLLVQADCAAYAGDWTLAARYYLWAVQAAPEGSSRRALAHYNLAVAAGYLGDRDTLIQASGAYQQICASRAWAAPICAQLQAAGPPQQH